MVRDFGNTDYRTDNLNNGTTTPISTTAGVATELMDNKTLTLTVRPTNDHPTISTTALGTTSTVTLAAPLTTPPLADLVLEEDNVDGLAFSGIVVADPLDQPFDPHETVMQLTLTVTNGGLTFNTSGTTLTTNSVLANADGSAPDPTNVNAPPASTYEVAQFIGTTTQLNAVLASVVYFNDLNFNTEDATYFDNLVVKLNDLGNTDYRTAGYAVPGHTMNNNPAEAGGQHLSDLNNVTLPITVLPMNDAPVLTADPSTVTTSTLGITPLPPNLTFDEDSFGGLTFSGIRVNETPDDKYDPDDVIVDVMLTVVHGGLKITTAAGITIRAGATTLATADGTFPDRARIQRHGCLRSADSAWLGCSARCRVGYADLLQRQELQHGRSAGQRSRCRLWSGILAIRIIARTTLIMARGSDQYDGGRCDGVDGQQDVDIDGASDERSSRRSVRRPGDDSTVTPARATPPLADLDGGRQRDGLASVGLWLPIRWISPDPHETVSS